MMLSSFRPSSFLPLLRPTYTFVQHENSGDEDPLALACPNHYFAFHHLLLHALTTIFVPGYRFLRSKTIAPSFSSSLLSGNPPGLLELISVVGAAVSFFTVSVLRYTVLSPCSWARYIVLSSFTVDNMSDSANSSAPIWWRLGKVSFTTFSIEDHIILLGMGALVGSLSSPRQIPSIMSSSHLPHCPLSPSG
jgi:hypothetical protein